MPLTLSWLLTVHSIVKVVELLGTWRIQIVHQQGLAFDTDENHEYFLIGFRSDSTARPSPQLKTFTNAKYISVPIHTL